MNNDVDNQNHTRKMICLEINYVCVLLSNIPIYPSLRAGGLCAVSAVDSSLWLVGVGDVSTEAGEGA